MQSIVQFNVDIADQCIPHCLLDKEIEMLIPLKELSSRPFILIWLTSSSWSQASLLGAKKVKDPDPSISGLSLEMSA